MASVCTVHVIYHIRYVIDSLIYVIGPDKTKKIPHNWLASENIGDTKVPLERSPRKTPEIAVSNGRRAPIENSDGASKVSGSGAQGVWSLCFRLLQGNSQLPLLLSGAPLEISCSSIWASRCLLTCLAGGPGPNSCRHGLVMAHLLLWRVESSRAYDT